MIEVKERSKAPHLVSLVKSMCHVSVLAPIEALSVPTNEERPDSWYTFNDFVVQEVDESEVLDFSPDWKVSS